MVKYFDTHAHYFDKKFEEFSLNGTVAGADALLDSEVMRDTVSGIINVGTNIQSSLAAIEQAAGRDFMYAAVGIHPEDAQNLSLDAAAELERLEELISSEDKLKANKIVAIGEIGFDYYWQPVDKAKQSEFFEGQLALAKKYSLPVIVHDREAHGDSLDTVSKFSDVKGVFHAYSGSIETARELTRRGWYIGLGGAVTFKSAERLRAVASALPLDRILLETDCPYMSPVPHRGTVNHSALLPCVAEVLSGLYGIDCANLARITEENARRLFDRIAAFEQ
ncbi:MAG: TatD family deoxyribonuclease [Ruminococcaceae bacterium]|nr:TatD family deoxyribonuclease [Oscillospiraceae bacterium]